MSDKKTAHRRRPSAAPRYRNTYHRHTGMMSLVRHFSFSGKEGRRGCLLGAVGVLALYIWIFYYVFVGPTGFRWRALYGDPKYPQGYAIHGIDISHHQGTIDWNKLKSNGLIDGNPLRFVFIKATEGSSRVDPNFEENFSQAYEYGFIRGVYHFWSNQSSARAQAYHFLNNVRLLDGDLPPVLDIEHKPKDVSIEDFQMDVLTWLHIVEDKYHVKPIIYTYYKFREKYLNAPVFDDYPYWIAHYYIDKMEYKGNWRFWQHTDTGQLPGINGNVDLNVYNGSYYDLLHLTIGKQELVPTNIPVKSDNVN
jgi:lysozyme